MIAKQIAAIALCTTVLFAPARAEQHTSLPGCADALSFSDANNGVAVLVLEEGRVICSSRDVSKAHEIWSGTKSFVGLMAAAAVQDKLLTLDEKAADTLTEWKNDPEKSKVTLRQLLSMTSGQASTIGKPQGYSNSVKAKLAAVPGTKFQYGPTPMQVFGEIMRRKLVAVGQDDNPRRYLERRIFEPLGIQFAEWRNGDDGQPLMPQGAVITAQEWAKVGEFVRAGGRQGDKALVDPNAFSELFKGTDVNPAYGLTWWLPKASPSRDFVTLSTDITEHADELPADMVVAAGAGEQRLYVIPSRKITIVRQARLDFIAMAAGKQSGWSDTRFLRLLLGL